MKRLVLALALALTGCAGVPAAVVWGTVGAGLGATAAALTLDTEILRVWESRHPAAPVMGNKP